MSTGCCKIISRTTLGLQTIFRFHETNLHWQQLPYNNQAILTDINLRDFAIILTIIIDFFTSVIGNGIVVKYGYYWRKKRLLFYVTKFTSSQNCWFIIFNYFFSSSQRFFKLLIVPKVRIRTFPYWKSLLNFISHILYTIHLVWWQLLYQKQYKAVNVTYYVINIYWLKIIYKTAG